MRKTIAILFPILYSSLSCLAAARTASVSGNWSNTATWGGSSVPGNGDTITINSGVTVSVSDNRTIGTSPADCSGTQAIQNNSGTLAILTGNTLTARGCIVLAGTAQLTEAADSVLEFDASAASSPSATHYKLGIGAANGNTARLTLTGSDYDHPAILRSNASGGNGSVTDGGFDRGGMVSANYFKLLRIGTASIPAIEFNPTSNSDVFTLQRGTCDACGTTKQTNFHDGAHINFDSVTWMNSLSNPLQVGGYLPSLGITVANSVFDGTPLFYTARKMVITNNIFMQGWGNTGGAWDSFDYNIYIVDATHNNGYDAAGSMSNVYALAGATLTNPHFINTATTFDLALDGFIFEDLGATSDGDCVLLTNEVATYTIRNSIKLPNGVGQSTCAFGSQGGGPNSHMAYYKNTIFLGGFLESSGMRIAESYPGNAGMITAMKSNLYWDTTARGYKLHCAAQPCNVLDAVTGSNADYNGGASTQFLAGSAGKGYDNTFTTAPGVHDLDLDPGFVDRTRNFAKYDLSCGGPGTAANALAQFQARNSSTWNSCYDISKLMKWVRQGFAPQNASYATAGHDGGRIGAVDPIAIMGGVLAQ
jgi:hypothetical protein